jgi:hypothetical protein
MVDTFTTKALLLYLTEIKVIKIKACKCGMITIHGANIFLQDGLSK